MELTVLGCCGSYGDPAHGGACSGYLVRQNDTTIWLDAGNGTFPHLQTHLSKGGLGVEDLTAVVLTHGHPDHCVDIYGLHVMLKYGLGRSALPVYAPEGVAERLGALVDDDWGGSFEWHVVADSDTTHEGDIALAFSKTDHPLPTMAVECTGGGSRLIYTADTGPGWEVGAFASGAELVVSEASYQNAVVGPPIHLTARQAGEAAVSALAHRLVLTHLWPSLDPAISALEAAEAFGQPVTMAASQMSISL